MTDLKLIRPVAAHAVMLDERGDDELMLLASAGRTDAFTVLVGRYVHRLSGLCAKLIGSRSVGEEIGQEAWLQVWAARSRYQPDGRFRVYLYTIARNRCRNHLRDTTRRSRWLDDEPAADGAGVGTSAPDHLDALIEEERRHRVNQAIGRLPGPLREVLLLRFSEGLDYSDVARIVGRTESAARARVYQALEKLRADLDRGTTP